MEFTLEERIRKKTRILSRLWKEYFLAYKFCRNQIKFNIDKDSNYVSDIFTYFSDIYDLLNDEHDGTNFKEAFQLSISLMQGIYIQQDFIEELHRIFKTKIVKGDLKLDTNYSKNREIRNEAIGHPIRKTLTYEETKGSEEILSSVIFAKQKKNHISYLRYHKDNNYNFESLEYSIIEIVERHFVFVETNLDKILTKIYTYLNRFIKKLREIINNIDKLEFEKLLKLIGINYEQFFQFDVGYDYESISQINEKRNLHIRYQFVIQQFKEELSNSLNETINLIKEYKNEYETRDKPNTNITLDSIIEKVNNEGLSDTTNSKKNERNFDYELGKLGNPKNGAWDIFYNTLIEFWQENKEIFNELNNLKANREDKIEYYSSYHYLYNLVENASN